MLGSWKLEEKDDKLEIMATRTLDGHFITRTVRINRGEGDVFTIVEVIGFDPSQGTVRSWFFDSEGGFGGAVYRREGNKWMALTTATLPEGGEASSQHIFTVVDGDHVEIEAVNRVLDGEVLPNKDRVRMVRVAGHASTETLSK